MKPRFAFVCRAERGGGQEIDGLRTFLKEKARNFAAIFQGPMRLYRGTVRLPLFIIATFGPINRPSCVTTPNRPNQPGIKSVINCTCRSVQRITAWYITPTSSKLKYPRSVETAILPFVSFYETAAAPHMGCDF